MNRAIQTLSRREMLKNATCGFGAIALAGLCGQTASARRQSPSLNPKYSRIAPRAKRVIFIFMQGGPSHVDSFDLKPELIQSDGKDFDFVGVRQGTFGKASKRKLMKPLWSFKRHGECGQPVSTLFPEIAKHVDDLCFIHSMHTNGVAHGPSTLFLHTGATNLVRPSMGSWITYGLGTENQNLPGFITINPADSKGGPRNYSNAFLPAIYQGTCVGRAGVPATKANFPNITNKQMAQPEQKKQFDFIQGLNHAQIKKTPTDDKLEATIKAYELAWRMQMNAPGLMDLSGESEAT